MVDVVYTGISDIDVEDLRRVVPRGEELLQVNLSTAKEQQLRFLRATKWENLLPSAPGGIRNHYNFTDPYPQYTFWRSFKMYTLV